MGMKSGLLQLYNWTHGAICLVPKGSRLGFASNCIKALLTCGYFCIFFYGEKSASFRYQAPLHSNCSFLSWLVSGGTKPSLPDRATLLSKSFDFLQPSLDDLEISGESSACWCKKRTIGLTSKGIQGFYIGENGSDQGLDLDHPIPTWKQFQ